MHDAAKELRQNLLKDQADNGQILNTLLMLMVLGKNGIDTIP